MDKGIGIWGKRRKITLQSSLSYVYFSGLSGSEKKNPVKKGSRILF